MKKISTKIIKFIENYDNIFFMLIIFLSFFGVTLNVFISSSDELWNFQSIYKMYNGYQIYKDFNVIITPFFFWIGEIMFKMLGANFLTFRIYNMIIMTALYFITYLLLKQIGIRKKISMIIVLLLIVAKKYFLIVCQANYNMMALMVCLLGVLLCIKKSKKHPIIQGIILFLIFGIKQNIVFYYGLGLFLYEILRKDLLKNKIKNLIKEFVVFVILTIGLFFYLNNNNILLDFINYTFLGISEFANKNIVINISYVILVTSLISINLVFTILFIRNKKINLDTEEKERLITLNCFSIPLNLIIMPIMNTAHFILGIYLTTILFINLIKIMVKECSFKIEEKIINLILIITCILLCTFSMYHFYSWTINEKEMESELKLEDKEEKPFYGGIMREEVIESINEVTQYIKRNPNNVIVVSNKAALYMVPLQRNNGILDLPFKGNIGKDGEKGLIEKIKSENNLEILIEKDEKELIDQESKTVRTYIIENMEKIGEIKEFYIYKNIKE